MTSTCALILSWYIKDSRSFFIWMLLSSSSTFVWLRKLYKTFKQSRRQIEAELLENDQHRNTETMRKTLILRAKYSVSSYPSYTVFSFSFSIIFLVTFFLLGTIWLSQRPYYVLLFNPPSLFSWKLISLQYEILHLKKSILPKYRHKFPRLPGTPSYPCYHWIIHIGTEHFFPLLDHSNYILSYEKHYSISQDLTALKRVFKPFFPL